VPNREADRPDKQQQATQGWTSECRDFEPWNRKLHERRHEMSGSPSVASGRNGPLRLMRDYRSGEGGVLRFLREVGVKIRNQQLSPANVDSAVLLYQSGLSLKAVGEELGFSIVAIRGARSEPECNCDGGPGGVARARSLPSSGERLPGRDRLGTCDDITSH